MAQEANADSNALQVGDILDGRYRLTRKIGSGGMGVVFQGTQLTLERTVAIKVMHAHLAERDDYGLRFEREVQIAKELMHPNTVRIYDFGTTKGTMYLVMEYLEGRELAYDLDQGPLSFRRAGVLGLQLLDGLAEAHALDVIHRDLKPGNLFLTVDRRGREMLKILDFGIAKSLGDDLPEITRTGQLVGTARYIPPEIIAGADVKKTTDIYAAGLILWEMVTGHKIFDAPSIREILDFHESMPVLLPYALANHPLAAVITKATEKDPGDRYADAEEMHADMVAANPHGWDDIVATGPDVEVALERIYAAVGLSYHNDKRTTEAEAIAFPPSATKQKQEQKNKREEDEKTTAVVEDLSDTTGTTVQISETMVLEEEDFLAAESGAYGRRSVRRRPGELAGGRGDLPAPEPLVADRHCRGPDGPLRRCSGEVLHVAEFVGE